MERSPKHTTSWMLILIAVAVVIWLAFLMTMIILKGSDIGSPATETEAVVRSNERLLQLAQWTIATVLTVGGALIGFNWYLNQRERDAVAEALAEVTAMSQQLPEALNELEERLNARLVLLENVTLFLWDAATGQKLLQEAEALYHPLPVPVRHFVNRFLNASLPFADRRASLQLVGFTIHQHLQRGGMDEQDMRSFQQALPAIFAFDEGMARAIVEQLSPGQPAQYPNSSSPSDPSDDV